MAELNVTLVPPSQRGVEAALRDGCSEAALVITHTHSRADRGRKFHIPAGGLIVGAGDGDILVAGARESGTRLEIGWVSQPSGAAGWQAEARGRVSVNRENVTRRVLESGDEVRVVDTFFRLLTGPGLERQYHETIYQMAISDIPTRLANARYLSEALDRDVVRAQRHGNRLAVAVLRFDAPAPCAASAADDLLREAADRIREQVPSEWFAARAAELELVVLAPEASKDELERNARQWLQACVASSSSGLGIAELTAEVQDAPALLTKARASVVPLRD